MTFRVSDLMVDVLSASCPDPSLPPCQAPSNCPDPSKPQCPDPSKPQCPDPSKPTGRREMSPLDGLSTLRQQLRYEVQAHA